MSVRARRGRRLSAALLLLCSVTSLLGCKTLAEAVVFTTGDDPLPASGTVLESGWRIVSYSSSDGITLRGAILQHPTPRPTVVWFHGTGDCAAHNLARARVVFEGGLDLFLAEYRGYGGCAGTPSEAGLIADGRAALNAVERELGVPEAEAILLGISLGTGVVAALAAEGRGRAAVLIAPYTSIREIVGDVVSMPIARLCVPDLFPSLDRLKQSKQPVLVIHGTADAGIPFAHSERIVRALKSRATLVALEGAGHDDRFEARHWERIAREVAVFSGRPRSRSALGPPLSPQ